MSAQSPSSATAASCATTWSGVAWSVLVTIATTGVARESPASSAARYLSPGPIVSVAGRQNPITSTSVRVERTRLSSRSPSRVRGRCRPGVSTMISCASGRCTIPRMARRVVCGRLLVMAILVPTSAFIRVDLPTFGRPTKQAKPDLNSPGRPAGAPALPVLEGAALARLPGVGDRPGCLVTWSILPYRALRPRRRRCRGAAGPSGHREDDQGQPDQGQAREAGSGQPLAEDAEPQDGRDGGLRQAERHRHRSRYGPQSAAVEQIGHRGGHDAQIPGDG